MAPYNSDFSRRYCLVARAQARDDWSEMYVQQGINMFECFAVQLNGRFPDSFGASKKVEFQKDILRILESFGNGKGVPDGWKCFYAYRQLVLSACLFALNKTEEAWENFDSAIEKCKYVTNLKDEWLDIGGPVFANVKANKIWNYAIDEKGQTHKLFGLVRHSCADMWLIHSLLTNPRWAWFDSVRETPKYKEALEWVEAAEKKVRSTFES